MSVFAGVGKNGFTTEGTEKPIMYNIQLTRGTETVPLLGFLRALSVLCGETVAAARRKTGIGQFTQTEVVCPRAEFDQPRLLGRIEPPESNPRRAMSSKRGWLKARCQSTRAASSRVYWPRERCIGAFIKSTRRL